MAHHRGTEPHTEDTAGLKDKFVTIIARVYENARDHGGLIESDWLNGLLVEHLPGLINHLTQKFPTGPHFYTGHLDYDRISANLSYLEVRI